MDIEQEITWLRERVLRLEEQWRAKFPLLDPDGRPLGWELTAEAKGIHNDEQAVGGSAPREEDVLVPENVHEYSPEASDSH